MTYEELQKLLEGGFTRISHKGNDMEISITLVTKGEWVGWEFEYIHPESDPYFTARDYFYVSSLKDLIVNMKEFTWIDPSDWVIENEKDNES